MRHDGEGTTRAALADIEARAIDRQRLSERVLRLLPASRALVCMLVDDPGTKSEIDRLLAAGRIAERVSSITRRTVLVSRSRLGVAPETVETGGPGQGAPSKWSRRNIAAPSRIQEMGERRARVPATKRETTNAA